MGKDIDIEENRTSDDWIARIKGRGMTEALDLTLNVLEPIGPLAAQLLYTLQPLLGVIGLRDMIDDLAQALDEPDGVDRLRERINRDMHHE